MRFSCRGSRSSAMTAVFAAVVLIETAVFHLLLVSRLPVVAYLVTASSLGAVWWIVADYRALGGEAGMVDAAGLHLGVGRRLQGDVARERIARAFAPSWTDLRPGRDGVLNATKPASPNVLIVFSPPQPLRILGAITRPVSRLALRVDDPAALLSALGAPSS